MAEELEEESRRARRREQRGISLALGLLPRAHGRRRLQVALSALREWTRCAALQRAHEQQLRGLAATVSAHGAARDAADAARAATEAALAAESERWRVGAEESARLAAELRTRDGELAAYMTVPGTWALNHAVAETESDMKALILGAAEAGPDPVGFLVPIRHADLFHWCILQGLSIVKPMTLMTRGTYLEPQGAWLPSVFY